MESDKLGRHHQSRKQSKQEALWDNHYHRLVRSFSRPHLLSLETGSLQPWLTVSLPNGTQQRSPLAELTLQQCRSFFWKDCLIYINITSPHGRPQAPTYADVSDHEKILNAVYKIWFPTRDRQYDQCLNRDDFFASLVCCCPTKEQEPPHILQIRDIHHILCNRMKLCSQDNALSQPESEQLETRTMPPEDFFTPSFGKAFIVIDQLDWEDKGALLVQCQLPALCDALLDKSLVHRVKKKPYKKAFWRMPLHDAMKIITGLSNNEQRVTARQGESVFFEERFENKTLQDKQLSVDKAWQDLQQGQCGNQQQRSYVLEERSPSHCP